jgi:anti-sigma factor RsiW
MSQNHRLPLPDCAACAPLLPLVAHDLLSEEQATALHAHLATCPSCRAELATYDQAEDALRHAFSVSPGVMPPLSKEQIMHALTGRPALAAASSAGSVLRVAT